MSAQPRDKPKAVNANLTARMFSAMYDVIVMFAILAVFVGGIITAVEASLGEPPAQWVQWMLFTSISYAYYVGFWHKGGGATTGMRPWKLQVADIQTGLSPNLMAASVRFVVFMITLLALGITLLDIFKNNTANLQFIVSSLIPFVSLICMLLTPRKQALHDLLAGTSVFRVWH
ncbi:MAG: RDD family protein [Mariprofundaceae bacterium]|nr:RDD family protein [Mariprofundaceae bacterium]